MAAVIGLRLHCPVIGGNEGQNDAKGVVGSPAAQALEAPAGA